MGRIKIGESQAVVSRDTCRLFFDSQIFRGEAEKWAKRTVSAGGDIRLLVSVLSLDEAEIYFLEGV